MNITQFYYRCADDWNQVKSRFYWYFKYSLVSTLKAKLKFASRFKIFCKYGHDISCLEHKNFAINFSKWENLKRLEKNFLVNIKFKDSNKISNMTWINTKNTNIIFNLCSIKECDNTVVIQIHHFRNLQKKFSNSTMFFQNLKKKLKNWESIFFVQKAKQLKLCKKHY